MRAVEVIRKRESEQLIINATSLAVVFPISMAIPAVATTISFVLRVVINGKAGRVQACILSCVPAYAQTRAQAHCPLVARVSRLYPGSAH